LYEFLISPVRATCPAHLIRLDFYHPNITEWSVKIMTFLIMQSSSASGHFLPLECKYSPQYPVLKHPQSTFLP
jgi:hypothetical protein